MSVSPIQEDLPKDQRVTFATYYQPCDIIGGDYYATTQLGEDCYGFFLADVTGHGVPAALYTMFLRSLWEAHGHLLLSPEKFADAMNASLCRLVKETEPFAVATCGLLDLKEHEVRLVAAGNPSPILVSPGGDYERLNYTGLPLGCLEDARYDEETVALDSGDCLLFFTDGAVEISQGQGQYLDVDGLIGILKRLGYPGSGVSFQAIEKEMLRLSDRIRFDDDLTFFEIRLS